MVRYQQKQTTYYHQHYSMRQSGDYLMIDFEKWSNLLNFESMQMNYGLFDSKV